MNFAKETLDFIGAQYMPQGFDKNQGFDCFSTAVGFMRKHGFDLPPDMEWNGLTFDNYYQLWKKNKEEAVEKMIEFFETFTERKPLKDLTLGDILIVKNIQTQTTFCAVYGGKDKVITSDMELGVLALPLRHFEILEIYKGTK